MFKEPEPAAEETRWVRMRAWAADHIKARQRVMDDFVKALNGAKSDLDALAEMQQ